MNFNELLHVGAMSFVAVLLFLYLFVLQKNTKKKNIFRRDIEEVLGPLPRPKGLGTKTAETVVPNEYLGSIAAEFVPGMACSETM